MVRHGQTDWNIERRVQGWTDVPLNRNGTRQAQLLAEALHGIPFHTLYTSDLSRARTTGAILQAQLGVPLHVDTRLRERYFGRAEGTHRSDEDVTCTAQSTRVTLASSPSRHATDVDDGRESDQEVLSRANSFLRSLVDTHGQGRILCVSHGGFIRIVLNELGWRDEGPLQNTGVSKLSWTGHEWRIISTNWANHLRS